jgi:hypothetical protein
MKQMEDTIGKVEVLLERSVFNTKKLLSIELGMSRPTLNSRLDGRTEWGKLEKNWINHIYKKIKK